MSGITCSEKGVWELDDAYKRVLSEYWGYTASDPGTLWVWGLNSFGNLGDDTVIHRSSPIQIPGTTWKTIKTTRASFAIKGDNTLWAWGTNTGTLGDDTQTCRSSPTQIPGTSWNDITGGFSHTLALKTDGTLWAWGAGSIGKLGDNTITPKSSPIQIPGTSWSDIAATNYHSLALKTDGTLWIWGNGDFGPLGNDTTGIHKSSPIQVPGTSWSSIASICQTSLALKTDGTLWSWGRNDYGHLGINTSNQAGQTRFFNKSSPVQIPGNSWNDIAGDGEACHIFARKTDGTLWGWGQTGSGQLGINCGGTVYIPAIYSCVPRSFSSPVQVPGTSWADVATGALFTLALKTDGTLWSWGSNVGGILGDNTVINRSSPVQVPGTCWIDISGGTGLSMAKKRI